jgi:hypothetical protein
MNGTESFYAETRIKSLNWLRNLSNEIAEGDLSDQKKMILAGCIGAATYLASTQEIIEISETQSYESPEVGSVGLTQYLCRNAPKTNALQRMLNSDGVAHQERVALNRKQIFTGLFGGLMGFDPIAVVEGRSQPNAFIEANKDLLSQFREICIKVNRPVKYALAECEKAEALKAISRFEADVMDIASNLDLKLVEQGVEIDQDTDPFTQILHQDHQEDPIMEPL